MKLPEELNGMLMYSFDGSLKPLDEQSKWILLCSNISEKMVLCGRNSQGVYSIAIGLSYDKPEPKICINDCTGNKLYLLNKLEDQMTEFVNDTLKDYTLDEFTHIFSILTSSIERAMGIIDNIKLDAIGKKSIS